jgi:hypothetical protein
MRKAEKHQRGAAQQAGFRYGFAKLILQLKWPANARGLAQAFQQAQRQPESHYEACREARHKHKWIGLSTHGNSPLKKAMSRTVTRGASPKLMLLTRRQFSAFGAIARTDGVKVVYRGRYDRPIISKIRSGLSGSIIKSSAKMLSAATLPECDRK